MDITSKQKLAALKVLCTTLVICKIAKIMTIRVILWERKLSHYGYTLKLNWYALAVLCVQQPVICSLFHLGQAPSSLDLQAWQLSMEN